MSDRCMPNASGWLVGGSLWAPQLFDGCFGDAMIIQDVSSAVILRVGATQGVHRFCNALFAKPCYAVIA